MKINLFINLYYIENENRRNEIELCLMKNILFNKEINIICLDEGFNFNKINKKTIEIIRISERPLFSTFLKYFKKNEINIISNNDIYFDYTIKKILNIFIFKNTCFALSRIEKDNNIFRSAIGDTQDVWVFYGIPDFLNKCNFYLGVPGCDNKLAFEAWNKNYVVLNPSKYIKCFHIHEDETRNYSEADRLPKPYMHIIPIGLFKSIFIIFYSNIFIRFLNLKIVRFDQKIL